VGVVVNLFQHHALLLLPVVCFSGDFSPPDPLGEEVILLGLCRIGSFV